MCIDMAKFLGYKLVLISLIEAFSSIQEVRCTSNPSEVYETQRIPSSSCSDANESTCCLPWSFCVENGQCECFFLNDISIPFECDGHGEFIVLSSLCFTYNDVLNVTSVGASIYVGTYQSVSGNYDELRNNKSALNTLFCDEINRAGTLCSQCKQDYFPLAYSFDLACVPCPGGHRNWWKYVLAAFLPLTIFYLLVLFFHVSVASSFLHGFVVYCQTIASPLVLRGLLVGYLENPMVRLLMAFYGVWNLDFFRSFDLGEWIQFPLLHLKWLWLCTHFYLLDYLIWS